MAHYDIEKQFISAGKMLLMKRDGLAMPKRCGDFAEVMHAFETRGNSLHLERIVGYALRIDVAATWNTWEWETSHTP